MRAEVTVKEDCRCDLVKFGKTSLVKGKSDCQMNFKTSSLHFTSDTMLSYAIFLPVARTGRGMELSKADTKVR